MDAEKLRQTVEEILLRKSTDLSQISRGKILTIISEEQPGVELLCEKAEIKEIITKCFQEVSELSTTEDNFKADKEAKTSRASADEEVARKLHDELNGKSRTRSTKRTSSTTKASSSSSKSSSKRKYKSDDIVIDSDEDEAPTSNGASQGTTKKRKSATKKSKANATDEKGSDKPKRGGGGFTKVYHLTEPLAELVGESQLKRPEVVKKLWSYIKENQLQDPNNGSHIICDDNLRNLFGVATVSSFKMNKYLSKHLYDPEKE